MLGIAQSFSSINRRKEARNSITRPAPETRKYRAIKTAKETERPRNRKEIREMIRGKTRVGKASNNSNNNNNNSSSSKGNDRGKITARHW